MKTIDKFIFGSHVAIEIREMNLFYGDFQALKNIDMTIPEKQITAMIGPSGCGKSTLLKSLNRMNDLVEGCKVEGVIQIGGQNIYEKSLNLAMLRKNVGMVFQRPNPFAMSVYDNVAYGPRTFGIRRKFGQIRARSFRRTAAAPLHRAGARRRAADPLDGRTHFRARSHLDGEDRGTVHRIKEKFYYRHGNAQYAAGGAHFR